MEKKVSNEDIADEITRYILPRVSIKCNREAARHFVIAVLKVKDIEVQNLKDKVADLEERLQDLLHPEI